MTGRSRRGGEPTLFDTSVLVAGLIESHAMHLRCRPWLVQAVGGEFEMLVASHSLAELYAVLSTLPIRPRIAPATAWQLVDGHVRAHARVISLTAVEQADTVRSVAELGLSGGVVHDAVIARAALKGGAKRLLTLNPSDFRRVCPPMAEAVVVP